MMSLDRRHRRVGGVVGAVPGDEVGRLEHRGPRMVGPTWRRASSALRMASSSAVRNRRYSASTRRAKRRVLASVGGGVELGGDGIAVGGPGGVEVGEDLVGGRRR